MIRVFVVSDIRLYRDGLAEILRRQALLEVVGTAANEAAAVGLAAELCPDVILVDQAMSDSVAMIRALQEHHSATKIVALGVPETDREIIDCAEAGVSGYVPREASLDDLVAVVEGVGRGELLCSPRVAASLLRRVASSAAGGWSAAQSSHLTPREGQIVRLIEQGLSNKEIASRLGIEVATVKNHVHNLLDKLQVHRRAEAADRLRRPLRPATGFRSSAAS